MGFAFSTPGATLPIDLTSEVTGILPIANGGTNLAVVGAALQHLRTNAAVAALEYADPATQLIDSHIALGSESTYTFTPATAIAGADVAEVIVEINGDSDAAFNLLMELNNDASAQYFTDGRSIVGGVEGIIDINAATSGQLLGASIGGGNDTFHVKTIIYVPDASIANDIIEWNTIGGSTLRIDERVHGLLSVVLNEINDFEWKTSASTWGVGTTIDTYVRNR